MTLTKADVADLLSIIVAFDRRTIGHADVEAWHLVINDLDRDDCAQAIAAHYAESTRWIMPADIRTRALESARHRAGQQRAQQLQAQNDAEQHAIGTTPVEPVDREQLRARLRALAARGLGRVPRVDGRGDDARRLEALAHLERLRANPPVCSCPDCVAARETSNPSAVVEASASTGSEAAR